MRGKLWNAWAAAAGEHGREVYRDDDNDVEAQLQRLTRLQSLAQRELAQEWQPPVVKFHDFLNALAGAKACKQPRWYVLSAGQLFLWLYLLFLVRLGGWETERPEA